MIEKKKVKVGKRLIPVLIFAVFLISIIWYQFRIFPVPQLSRLLLGRNSLFRVIKGERDYYIPDRVAGHIHKPGAVRNMKWPEHPDGSFRMAVNNLGFREDADTAREKDINTYRILVTGDSHIDGVVSNAESFPNRLETLLNSSGRRMVFEVINGGTGYYGPYNYAGFLKKFLYLKPDMFIVVIYSGNDFLDAIKTAGIRSRIRLPGRPEGYTRSLKEAGAENSGAVCQALNQAYFFQTYPELETVAVEIAYNQLLKITRTCAANGIELLILTLPTSCDISGPSPSSTWESARRKLGLSPNELGLNRRLGRSLLAQLKTAGVRTFDPFNGMRHSLKPLFWERDFHLNRAGHDLLARLVFEQLSYFTSHSK